MGTWKKMWEFQTSVCIHKWAQGCKKMFSKIEKATQGIYYSSRHISRKFSVWKRDKGFGLIWKDTWDWHLLLWNFFLGNYTYHPIILKWIEKVIPVINFKFFISFNNFHSVSVRFQAPPIFTSQGWGYRCSLYLGFYVRAGDLNPSPHACTASALSHGVISLAPTFEYFLENTSPLSDTKIKLGFRVPSIHVFCSAIADEEEWALAEMASQFLVTEQLAVLEEWISRDQRWAAGHTQEAGE